MFSRVPIQSLIVIKFFHSVCLVIVFCFHICLLFSYLSFVFINVLCHLSLTVSVFCNWLSLSLYFVISRMHGVSSLYFVISCIHGVSAGDMWEEQVVPLPVYFGRQKMRPALIISDCSNITVEMIQPLIISDCRHD